MDPLLEKNRGADTAKVLMAADVYSWAVTLLVAVSGAVPG